MFSQIVIDEAASLLSHLGRGTSLTDEAHDEEPQESIESCYQKFESRVQMDAEWVNLPISSLTRFVLTK